MKAEGSSMPFTLLQRCPRCKAVVRSTVLQPECAACLRELRSGPPPSSVPIVDLSRANELRKTYAWKTSPREVSRSPTTSRTSARSSKSSYQALAHAAKASKRGLASRPQEHGTTNPDDKPRLSGSIPDLTVPASEMTFHGGKKEDSSSVDGLFAGYVTSRDVAVRGLQSQLDQARGREDVLNRLVEKYRSAEVSAAMHVPLNRSPMPLAPMSLAAHYEKEVVERGSKKLGQRTVDIQTEEVESIEEVSNTRTDESESGKSLSSKEFLTRVSRLDASRLMSASPSPPRQVMLRSENVSGQSSQNVLDASENRATKAPSALMMESLSTQTSPEHGNASASKLKEENDLLREENRRLMSTLEKLQDEVEDRQSLANRLRKSEMENTNIRLAVEGTHSTLKDLVLRMEELKSDHQNEMESLMSEVLTLRENNGRLCAAWAKVISGELGGVVSPISGTRVRSPIRATSGTSVPGEQMNMTPEAGKESNIPRRDRASSLETSHASGASPELSARRSSSGNKEESVQTSQSSRTSQLDVLLQDTIKEMSAFDKALRRAEDENKNYLRDIITGEHPK